MESEKFDLVFSGQVANGHDVAQVKKNIAQLFRIDGAKVEALFSGKPIVLKKSLDAETANKYRVAMKKAGALVNIVQSAVATEKTQSIPNSTAAKPEPQASPAQSPASSKPASAAVDQFTTTAGAGGDKVTVKPAPDVAVPNFGIAAPGADLLTDSEKPKVESVKVDISEISLAEPQGNLVSDDEISRPEAVSVAVPELDVAEAGSDVLKPEERKKVKPVDVDTSMLSVAAPGERLAPASQSAATAPNVDHIKLVQE